MSRESPRCLWCNGEGELVRLELDSPQPFGKGTREVVHVHPEHREDLLAFHSRTAREGSRFLRRVLLLMLGMVILEVGLVLWHAPLAVMGIGLAVLLLGLLLVRHPIPSPQTVQLFGARRALRLVRSSGWAVACLGLAVLLAGAFLAVPTAGHRATSASLQGSFLILPRA